MAICGKCKAENVGLAHIKECYGIKDDRPNNRAPNDPTWHDDNDFFEGCDPVNDRVIPDSFPGEPVTERWKDQDPSGVDPRVDVNVPFAEKEKAKLLGAKWDARKKTWYFPNGLPAEYPNSWVSRRQAPKEIEDGFYYVMDQDRQVKIYKVLRSQAGNQYAKVLDPSEGESAFGYEPGGIQVVREQGKPLTLEQAKEFGQLYGICIMCGRTLTNEESIEAGIGPICATKL